MRPRTARRHDNRRLTGALGLAAIAAAAVIGFVSYNALSGLPFQSRYDFGVAVPNAERLIATDDVRIGGVRVGQVTGVVAMRPRAGAPPYALVRVAIDPSVGAIPVDTTAAVRAASALGATYLQLTLGYAHTRIPPGGVLPLARASNTVAVTDLFQIFNGSAARNLQDAIGGLASGFAGRGTALNSGIGSLSSLLPALTSVESALASRGAQLAGFLSAWASTSGTLAPKSSELAALVAAGATTLGPLSSDRADLGATIAATPPAESAAMAAFTRVRPALDGLAELVTQLAPGARGLHHALATVNSALSAAVPPLRALPALTEPLRRSLTVLGSVSRLASTGGALRKLGDFMSATEQTLAVLTPAQVYCNVIGLFGVNVSSAILANGVGDGPAIGTFGLASYGNTTDPIQSSKPGFDAHIDNNPTENASQCQSGNEPFSGNRQDLSPPTGQAPNHTRTTSPPVGVLDRARSAGLLALPPSTP